MSDDTIVNVRARRVWDSRGRPTVEVDVLTESGALGRAIAPAGASTGSGEAVDLRDGGEGFGGYDVSRAVTSVNDELSACIKGLPASAQAEIDTAMIELDGTANKSRLGGNALIATSMAVLQAAAAAHKKPLWSYLANENDVTLPLPEIQIFGGGAHAAKRVDIQDFMVMAPGARSFAEALDWTAEIYLAAASFMKETGRLQGVADEGGFWPAFNTNEEALDALTQSIERAGFKPGHDVGISLDVAASEFGTANGYALALDNTQLDTSALLDLLSSWVNTYPILSIEDPVSEDDEAGFVEFARRCGREVQIIGDDFLVTNAERVMQAADKQAANAVLIKPNQAGTITETKAALDAAKQVGFSTIVSARSGETEDVTISHLSVGWNAGQLKVGSFSRSERMAKWNECLRIEESLGAAAKFAGGLGLPRHAEL